MTVIGHGYDDNVGAPAFRNLIINGGIGVDQRNNGAATTTTGAYPVDRFIFYGSGGGAWSNQRVVDAVSKVSNYALKTTVTTPDTSLVATDNYLYIQRIEGYNVAHLQFGTANAATVTLSFWVKCSVPGTYSVGFNNGAYTRSYVSQYTVSVANTWERKSITLTGDLTGTWTYVNDTGLSINWALGVGPTYSTTANSWQTGTFHSVTGSTNLFATNGATWQITGVQLEVGSVATPFEFEPFETTLRKCQRYFYSNVAEGLYGQMAIGVANTTSSAVAPIFLPVKMRAKPTAVAFANLRIWNGVGATNVTSIAFDWENPVVCGLVIQGASAVLSVSSAVILQANNTVGAYLTLNAEL
jgi:hypothetical protein